MTDEPLGAPREAYADPDFVIVRMTAVRALGSWEAAGCFQRIAWRCEREGFWRATMAEIAAEIGVSERTAKRITKTLRDLGWVTSERTDPYNATLTWTVIWAGQTESATQALSVVTGGPSGAGQAGPVEPSSEASPEGATVARSESDNLALSPLTETGKTKETKSGADAPRRDLNANRPDVQRVCDHLGQALRARDVTVADGAERSKRWMDAARLLMDADGRTETQVHNMIEWSQADPFWRCNIHSMPNLREHYSKMRDKALADKGKPVENRHTLPDDSPNRQARLDAWQPRQANGA